MTPQKPLRYPLGTIAAYGPDSTRATKLVASVLRQATHASPSELRTWQSEVADVRHDASIAIEVAEWFAARGVKETVTHDRIIGCPHEEGIEYPMGRTCPQCPFWADIDRFTHEPLTRPRALMTPEDVLATLSVEHATPPVAALESADAHREALIEPLLRAIDVAVDDPEEASESQAVLFAYALYLMARWRETRAFPHVLRWLSLPGEGAFDIGGDIVTQDGGRILAAVCDGDLAPIRALILNRDADEFSRSTGVSALARLAAWGEIARERVVAEFLWLAREGIEREPSFVWDDLATECADIEARELFPDIRRAFAEGWINPQSIGAEEIDEVEASRPGLWLDGNRERHPPIDDVSEAISWWSSFHESRSKRARGGDVVPEYERPEPYRAPAKVGRNERCPCGSGKKYKKCCGV